MSDDIEQTPQGNGDGDEYQPAALAPQNAASRIEHVTIEDEMRNAYIDYSMSVIVGRALPDVRDGLKPSNRRILFAMKERGWTSRVKFVKCAKVVGEVIGNYHPHGDAAIYDTLVRMAQDFSMRYMLVQGQGNFGSIDGDPAAAYRYTECKLHALAEELLADIDKETVDMQKTFDETRDEPVVLPSRFPNLLVNGSTGIAVGMATNIPPHNLGEVIDGLLYLIDHPAATVTELMQFVKGPDFPTGGTVCGVKPIREMYETGRGHLCVRGKARVEDWKNDRERIIISEIPYTVNKSALIEKIAELVHERKLEGISDLRDESDKDGIRVVVELKRGAVGEIVLNNLYKQTQLSMTFGAIMLAIDHGRPRILTLKDLMQCFIDHRFDVLKRRCEHELREAKARAHILEGLLIALDNLDEVVRIIRASRSRDDARVQLMGRFGLSELQANAILDMRLYQLTGLERDKVEAEYKAILERIAYLEDLLANPIKIYGVMKDDLRAVREEYADPRRTEIAFDPADISMEDLIADEDCVVTVTHGGYLKRTLTSVYREQKRGGKGLNGMDTKEEDWVEHVFNCSAHDWMLFFTEQGRMYFRKAYDIPDSGRTSRGKAIVNFLQMGEGEKIAAILPVRGFTGERNLFFATERGIVKKTPLAAYKNVRAAGLIAIRVEEGDRVVGVELTGGEDEIMLVTRQGQGIRFKETDVRTMGRPAAGVIGIRLAEGDAVEGLECVRGTARLLTITEKGYGKRTDFSEYRLQHRGGSGLIANELTGKTGPLVTALTVEDDACIMLVTKSGIMIRIPVDGIRVTGRNAQGVKLIDLEDGDTVMSATPVDPEEQKPEGTPDPEGEVAEAAPEGEVPAEVAEADAESEEASEAEPGDSSDAE